MRRRTLLRTVLPVAGAGTFSGCNGLFDRGSGPDSGSEPGGTPGSTAEPTGAPSLPYRAARGPTLDRPRGVLVRNLGSRERFVTLVVADGDAEVFVASRTIGAGEEQPFPGLVATGGSYRTFVETADGARRRYDWEVTDGFGDLWVELTPGIRVRRPALCTPDCRPLSTDGTTADAYRLPADIDLADVLDGRPAVALDNDGDDSRRASVRVAGRTGTVLDYDYEVPAGVRAIVPVAPPQPRFRVHVRTDAGEVDREWLPGVRSTIYASLGGEPRLRCGLSGHDLRVLNETAADRQVSVRAWSEGDRLFEGSFALDGGESRTVPSAVGPAGLLRFRVRTADGLDEEFDWGFCAPNGTIVVSVSDAGLFVSVQSAIGSP